MIAVFAHGVGSRSDLPLPLWMFAYGAAFALVISFTALRILWPRPRLAGASGTELGPAGARPAVDVATLVLRSVGLTVFAVTLAAAWFGVNSAASNIAPVAVYVVFWVGMQVASAVLGDVWRSLNPYDTLARLLRLPDETDIAPPGQWTAAVGLAVFAWLELAYHNPASPPVLALWLTLHSLVALAGAERWGRRWLHTGEPFAALFGLIARLAPFERDDASGRIRARWPLTGVAHIDVGRGTAALVLVALGSTTFDGFSRTGFWRDVLDGRTGWERTATNTLGMAAVIVVVALAYFVATRVAAVITRRDPWETARAYLPSLVPIMFAYTVAHYFSLLVFESQNFVALASDPLGRGWDLFGTIDNSINYRAVSTNAIAWVQAGAIVAGHVLGVIAAHDRAVERHPAAVALRSQYPLLGVMILYTVGGLGLLLGG